MHVFYMIFWSALLITALSIWRLRSIGQIFIVTAVTAVVLFTSVALFSHLSASAGANPAFAFSDPGYYLAMGPLAWLALLVLPCGWLGPMIGLHFVEKMNSSRQQRLGGQVS